MKAIGVLTKRLERIEEAAQNLRTDLSLEDRQFRVGHLLKVAAKCNAILEGIPEEDSMRIVPLNIQKYMAMRERGESPCGEGSMLLEELQFIVESFENYESAQGRGDKE